MMSHNCNTAKNDDVPEEKEEKNKSIQDVSSTSRHDMQINAVPSLSSPETTDGENESEDDDLIVTDEQMDIDSKQHALKRKFVSNDLDRGSDDEAVRPLKLLRLGESPENASNADEVPIEVPAPPPRIEVHINEQLHLFAEHNEPVVEPPPAPHIGPGDIGEGVLQMSEFVESFLRVLEDQPTENFSNDDIPASSLVENILDDNVTVEELQSKIERNTFQ